MPVSVLVGIPSKNTQLSSERAPGICSKELFPASTKSLIPSNLSKEGLHIVFCPSQPLTESEGKVKFISVPLFPLLLKSDHVEEAVELVANVL